MGGVDLGSVVKIKGGIGEFRGEKQITLERISMTSIPFLPSWGKKLVCFDCYYKRIFP